MSTKQKIDSFAALPTGWHYGEGVAPSSSTICNAHYWHELLIKAGYESTDAFAGAGGEIMVVGYHGEHSLDILLEPDNTMSLYVE